MSTCARCGRESPADASFCAGCGAPLEPQAAREERKVVTVLFADMVGSTERAEKLDPEDVRALLAAFYARLRSELERFGGTVEKFIGDAVMAVFGAPIAHEDDPERAVRAALAIREWAVDDGSIEVRIAVHTGEALVSLGAPAAGEGMVAGDVVNTAARLQSAAPVNGILVGEQTFRATDRVIDYREHEPVTGKGKSVPTRVWEAVQPRSAIGVDVRQHGRAPLVGRDDELDVLERAFRRATRNREPQLVTLVGVPGIGKSRLLFELYQRIDAGPEIVLWRQGRSLPYGDGIAFWALGEMVKAQSGILETDSPSDAAAKLASAAEAVVGAGEAAWVERHLRPLVGLAGEDAHSGSAPEEAFAAWRRFIEAIAEQRPLVLVFEDLHWAEDALLDFVDELVEWVSDVPLLVLGSTRPELLTRRPDWGGGKPNAATVGVSPLADADTARLVHALLDRAVLSAEVQTGLLARAGGNPLYAEEFVRAVTERGLADFGDAGLPESVQGLIAARLDGLPAEEKALLQNAAVLGKVFWTGALRTMGDGGPDPEALLHSLERKEFVRRERRSSVADDREYAFRHVLVRDLAYAQIPRARRSDKHRAAAAWLRSLGRPEDHVDLLAHHLVAALEYASESDTELARDTRLVLREAGERALGLHAFAAATRFFEQALALWPAEDEERPYLLLSYGRARTRIDGTGAELLDEASAGLLALGDEPAAAEAELLRGEIEWERAESPSAFERFDRAVALVATGPPSAAKARVLSGAGRFRAIARDPEAIELGRAALALADELGLDDVRAQASITIGTARILTGDDGGISDIEAGIALAEAAVSPEAARGYGNLSWLFAIRGDPRAEEQTLRALRSAERFGLARGVAFAKSNLADILFLQGRWAEVEAIAEEHLDPNRPNRVDPWLRLVRGRVRLARSDAAGAVEDTAAALELAGRVADPRFVELAKITRACLAAATGDLQVARELVDDVGLPHVAVRADNGTNVLALVEQLGLVEDYVRLAERESTEHRPWVEAASHFLQQDYRRAAEIYAAIGSRVDEAYARLRLAKELFAEGRTAEADAELQRALDFYRSVGAVRFIREAEAVLPQSA